MPRGTPLKHMTVEEITAHVNAKIPYVIGQGTASVVARGREMKRLMAIHGHDTDKFSRLLIIPMGGMSSKQRHETKFG